MPVLGAVNRMRSVRLRLLTLALLPLVVLLPVLLGVTMWRWIDKFDDLLISKVASDLRIAEQYFTTLEITQATEVRALAQSVEFAVASAESTSAVSELLSQESVRRDLDFLFVQRKSEPDAPPAFQEIAERATPDQPSAGVAVLDSNVLAALDAELAERAALPLVATEAARAIDSELETRGMVILVASHIPNSDSVLIGGRLLNRDLSIIDTMNALVYRERSDIDARTGTTTLFLDDVRISTNVRLFEEERALGTRVSEVVFDQVMGRGEPWLDRAFVVNDWYISGYLPLTDSFGNSVGMLYVGFLEEPFTIAKRNAFLAILAAFLAVLLLSAPVFLRVAKGIFAPLERMTHTMFLVRRGNLSARNGQGGGTGEIGEVAGHLDDLLDQVQERDEELNVRVAQIGRASCRERV